MNNSKVIRQCRVCSGPVSDAVIDLGEMALTGVFITDGTEVPRVPVSLVRCLNFKCGLLQLAQVYDLELLYGENYGYASSLNASMVKHLENRAARLIERLAIGTDDIVIDIGSNDATSLRQFPQVAARIGVDAIGRKFEQQYREIKADLVADFFPSLQLNSLLAGRKAKLISSYSCFYDLPDPTKFARSVAEHLADDGVWVLEQSYLPAMLNKLSFDTICHEHIEYYRLIDIDNICEQSGMKVIDVDFNEINGGSFVVYAVKNTADARVAESVKSVLNEERKTDWNEEFCSFNSEVDKTGNELRHLLLRLKEQGKSIYGLGASTKGNVLLQYFDIGTDFLSAIGDVNPDKFGKQTPGTAIPIISEADLLARNPDYLLVLPWHFRDFFQSSQKFEDIALIFPMPKIEVDGK